MAAFGGVVVSDPLLASQFRLNELCSLKSERRDHRQRVQRWTFKTERKEQGVKMKAAPELVEMDIEELLRLPAEEVLFTLVNYHLQKAGSPREITDFSSDLKDGETYTVLLNVLAPDSCNLSLLDLQDPYDRAKAVLAQAEYQLS
ncbi:hypothetical protein SELMODRAFT_423908 [Selaginella moellendorffii]|uniref:Calponin-homology (CH) domain-containing protein n=1 Tax=Selaginella moellendorffii TaxID=88036 RepID=D8SN71_SELML|nr:hypothetical protein SELMODRAFT_423908 [Selaginella moellendorffii]